ncbi:DUF4752 family protein [Serratia marcescens]|uniref:DUF4752 family protein n=1 Tax=Serratia marcescens TaxID=615 RepID=UPI001EF12FF4|nr:DUF4752 family protein [Serratia marcescens]ULH12433.1 DUF4752 family protein [Serratia marcescens]
MPHMDLGDWAMSGLMLIGYFFILVKSFAWLISVLFRQWDKRCQRSRRDMVLNDFCAVFKVDEMADGTTTSIEITDGITIVIIKPEV